MLRKIMGLFGILILAGLTGCLDSATVITVKKDGSGTIVETMYMGKAMQDMMAQMMGAMGGTNQSANPNMMLQSVEKYKAKTASMGQGVTFVSAKEAKKADGSLGAEVTYAFTDISKVRMNSDPDMPAGDGPGAAGTNPDQNKKSPISFQFAKGAAPKLTILMPPQDKSTPTEKTPATTTPVKQPSPEEMAEMKKMFDGFRMRLTVKVDGEITKSNAAYVEADSTTGKKQVVTLFDMDIGRLIQDEATFKKLAAMDQIKDRATARAKLANIAGLKFETADKVEIEFK
jgi:hypothetical protein